jgi:hypothetical protein
VRGGDVARRVSTNLRMIDDNKGFKPPVRDNPVNPVNRVNFFIHELHETHET